MRNATPASATPASHSQTCVPLYILSLHVLSLSLHGLLSLALTFSLLSLSFSFSLLISTSLYHFLSNALTLITWIPEFGDFTMFSEDLGECSRFPLDFPISSVDLYYSRFMLFGTNTFFDCVQLLFYHLTSTCLTC